MKIITNFYNIIPLIFITFGAFFCINAPGNKVYLLSPNDINNLKSALLFCYGREWWFDDESNARIINGILYFNCSDGSHIRTFPEEVNQPPIIITGKKYLVIELDNILDSHVIFKYSILDNNFIQYKGKLDGYKHKDIKIPLPKTGKSINHLQVIFSAEKCELRIKSIYII